MSEMLSQEEINQLLSNNMPKQEVAEQLTDIEKDALGEVGNISMGAAATVLHNLLNRRVTITTPNVKVISFDELASKYTIPYVAVYVSYIEGLKGDNLLIIKTDDVKAITSLLVGDIYQSDEPGIDDFHLSAISEVMNQMMGASATSMAKLIHKKINISPPSASIINFKEDKISVSEFTGIEEELVSTSFKMDIEDLFSTEIVLLMNVGLSKDIVSGFFEVKEPVVSEPKTIDYMQTSKPSETQYNEPSYTNEVNNKGQTIESNQKKTVDVRPIQFENFNEPAQNIYGENIDILMDVLLQVSVELGRTKKSLKEILDLNIGSIITLDKLAGESVDVVINGKMIAKGEVVVYDDNFGVRITDIINTNKNKYK